MSGAACPVLEDTEDRFSSRPYSTRDFDRAASRYSPETAAGYVSLDPQDRRMMTSEAALFWGVTVAGIEMPLRRPVSVRIRREGIFHFAENDTLHLSGHGLTQQDAMKDFVTHFIHYSQRYRRLPDENLTEDAKELKRIYDGLFADPAVNGAG